jgi:hypothetical protein
MESAMKQDIIMREAKTFLDESGVDWRIENGKKHRKLFVNGRMVQVINRTGTSGNWRDAANFMARLRKVVRTLKQEGAEA